MTAHINQHLTVIDQTHGGDEEGGYDARDDVTHIDTPVVKKKKLI